MSYYQYKDQAYQAIGQAKMKHPVTREWVEATVYTNIIGTETYVRETVDFENKFIPINFSGRSRKYFPKVTRKS